MATITITITITRYHYHYSTLEVHYLHTTSSTSACSVKRGYAGVYSFLNSTELFYNGFMLVEIFLFIDIVIYSRF